jgi:hypothetical protein
MTSFVSRGDATIMDVQSRSRPAYATQPWRSARLAIWVTALGLVLSSATIILSALDLTSIQQTIAIALAATLTTLGGLTAWMLPGDVWIAWRRGFRQGCQAAVIAQAYRMSGDLNASALWDDRLARLMGCPRAEDCCVCRCTLSS